jgi:hypothetical protein
MGPRRGISFRTKLARQVSAAFIFLLPGTMIRWAGSIAARRIRNYIFVIRECSSR